jgi:hypothetical protein
MRITLFYDSLGELKSNLFAITILNDYHITWHLLEQEGTQKSVFYQSRVLTENEQEELWSHVRPLMREKRVPNWISEEFEEKVQKYSEE